MMRQATDDDVDPDAASEPDSAKADASDEPATGDSTTPAKSSVDDAAPRRGLFAMMQRTGEPTEDAASRSKSSPPDLYDDVQIEEAAEVGDELPDDESPSPPALAAGVSSLADVIHPNDLEPSRFQIAARQARRQVGIGLVCGLAAIAGSTLSLLPSFLYSFPATALGFVAIIAGYLALTGQGRRDLSGSSRVLSILGMLMGSIGIFLGPLLFSNIGRSMRESTGQKSTHNHLKEIGAGLGQFYTQNDAYPIGGTFARDDSGAIRGQHGWMTFLLPFVGEAELHRQIDMSKAFDDPLNRNVMGQNVNVYFAAGGDRARIGDGFAVSHFAGVGGEIDSGSGLAHLGIFERDVGVKQDEITDGLSNTLIVGELAGTYPPWGDPENWRKIGKGLNKDINGFGSYSGNGAAFLLGDGSVKFFNNKTDPKLLEKMSTRDGAE